MAVKVKGTGVSGGSLAARRKWYDEVAAPSGGVMPDGNGNRKVKFHRPGSQNKSK
jgi:hypothetical protein